MKHIKLHDLRIVLGGKSNKIGHQLTNVSHFHGWIIGKLGLKDIKFYCISDKQTKKILIVSITDAGRIAIAIRKNFPQVRHLPELMFFNQNHIYGPYALKRRYKPDLTETIAPIAPIAPIAAIAPIAPPKKQYKSTITDAAVKRFDQSENNFWILAREIDGQPWFPATETARALGYEKPENAIRRHSKRRVLDSVTRTLAGHRSIGYICESDLYRLIMRSQLPSAEKFQDWVVEEVLPSIRKKGSYQKPAPKPKGTDAIRAMLDEIDGVKVKIIAQDAKIEAVKTGMGIVMAGLIAPVKEKSNDNTDRHEESVLTASQRSQCQVIFERKNAYYQASTIWSYMRRAAKKKFLPEHPDSDCTWHDIKQKDFEALVEFFEGYKLNDIDKGSLKKFRLTPKGQQDHEMWARRQGFKFDIFQNVES